MTIREPLTGASLILDDELYKGYKLKAVALDRDGRRSKRVQDVSTVIVRMRPDYLGRVAAFLRRKL
jgi:hypothetical protein